MRMLKPKSSIVAVLLGMIGTISLVLTAQSADDRRTIPPRLELKSPFSGSVQSLDSDQSGKILITSSSSHTLTLWTRISESQWEPRTIHAPVRDEFAAGVYLGAISPDGNYLAFAVPPLSNGRGGYQLDSARIYMIDRLSQQIITTFSIAIPTRIAKLRFSPDGRFLAAALGQGCGVRLWTRDQWTTPNRDHRPYWSDDDGYSGDSRASCCPVLDSSACEDLPNCTDVLFTGRSDRGGPWMITMSQTGLRTYLQDEHLPRLASYLPLNEMGLDLPGKIALSPDGEKLAVGDLRVPHVAVLIRSETGYRPIPRVLTIPERVLSALGKKASGAGEGYIFLANPVWTKREGRLLLYAFGYVPSGYLADNQPGSNANNFVVFDLERNQVQIGSLGDDTDTSLYAIQIAKPDVKPIFFVSTSHLSMIEPGNLNATSIATRAALDLRGNDFKTWRLMLHKERKVAFLTTNAGDHRTLALEFDFDKMQMAESQSFDDEGGLSKAIEARQQNKDYYDAAAKPDDWRFEFPIAKLPVPAFFGKPLSIKGLYRDERSYSGAELANKEMIVWGTSRALRLMNNEGRIVCARPVESPAFRMNVTSDGRMVVVAHGDGTIRWYSAADAPTCFPLVASLYLTKNQDGSWGFLAWLPNGKFMTSGGAALKNIACYPFSSSETLGPCIDFQETSGLYSPEDVRRALNSAESTETPTGDPRLTAVLGARQQERRAEVELDTRTEARDDNLAVSIKFSDLTDATTYLTLSAGPDLKFKVNGDSYSLSHPFAIRGRQTVDVVASLPPAVRHQSKLIKICPSVFSRLAADGTADLSSGQKLANGLDPCRLIEWKGRDAAPTRKKLWALLVGLSSDHNDAAPPLDYAHKDAIDFARFLQLDHEGKLPGKSSFDDVSIRLVITEPGKTWSALYEDPKIKLLERELGDTRFHLLHPEGQQRYDDLVRKGLSDIKAEINASQRADQLDWTDIVLVYFSGHGFSKNLSGIKPDFLFGLVTPNTDRNFSEAVVRVDKDLMMELHNGNFDSLLILDACSALIEGNGLEPLTSEQAQLMLKPYQGLSASSMQVYFADALGRYSYEQSDFSISDFVPNLYLWPDGIATKGGSVFSLGLLTSLLCQEAGSGHSYTFGSSQRFLQNQFFQESNKKWNDNIRPKLEMMMSAKGIAFAPPVPTEFRVDTFNDGVVLRNATSNEPKCGFTADGN